MVEALLCPRLESAALLFLIISRDLRRQDLWPWPAIVRSFVPTDSMQPHSARAVPSPISHLNRENVTPL